MNFEKKASVQTIKYKPFRRQFYQIVTSARIILYMEGADSVQKIFSIIKTT